MFILSIIQDIIIVNHSKCIYSANGQAVETEKKYL